MEMNNIVNIFGLHLGCKVKINKTGEEGKIINVSTSISNIGEGIITIEDLFSGMKTKFIEDCKLILKPLSKITDEDKAEFMEKFWNYGHFYIFAKLDDGGVYYKEAGSETVYSKKYFATEAFFLSTRGYKIEGIVPDEYCEVEE